ncbi:MAG: DUF3465 domain-containing protein [Xanthomonadales bacterium]|nr:DUF3465 domain-containing protein [Xanthomonadales bacterium]
MKIETKKLLKNILIIALLAGGAVLQQTQFQQSPPSPTAAPVPFAPTADSTASTYANANEAHDTLSKDVAAAFAQGRGDVWVLGEARVKKLLSDDTKPPRHQRFILELSSGHTVLVAHNIDLAPRVENLRVNSLLKIKGEYEWNEQGGVIHWTHHDPKGQHDGGWIEYRGQRYE